MFARINIRDKRIEIKKKLDEALRSAGLDGKFFAAVDIPIGQVANNVGPGLWNQRIPVVVLESLPSGEVSAKLAIYTDKTEEIGLSGLVNAGLATTHSSAFGPRFLEFVGSRNLRAIGSNEQFQVTTRLEHLNRREDAALLFEVAMRSVVSCTTRERELDHELVKFWNSSSSFDAVIAQRRMDTWWPILAIEYNGVQHLQEPQLSRDRKKFSICQEADLPVLVCWQEHLPPDTTRLANIRSKVDRKRQHRRRAFYDDFIGAIANFASSASLQKFGVSATLHDIEEAGVWVSAELFSHFSHEGPFDLVESLNRMTGSEYSVSVNATTIAGRRRPLQSSDAKSYSVVVFDRIRGVGEEVVSGISIDLQGGEFPLINLRYCLERYLEAWAVEYLFAKHQIEQTPEWGPMKITSWGEDASLW